MSAYPRQDLNLHDLRSLVPETSASTNSATWAITERTLKLVPRTRLELARPNGHYPLKVACLPVSPPGQGYWGIVVQR